MRTKEEQAEIVKRALSVATGAPSEAIGEAVTSTPDPTDDPLLALGDWYPEFRRFHIAVVRETPNFDYASLRLQDRPLYEDIKTKEAAIDALGHARLSEIMVIMRD